MRQIYSSSAWNYWWCWQGVFYALDRNVFDCPPHSLQRVEAYGLTSMVLTPCSIALSETHSCMKIGELHEFELPQHGQKSEMQHPPCEVLGERASRLFHSESRREHPLRPACRGHVLIPLRSLLAPLTQTFAPKSLRSRLYLYTLPTTWYLTHKHQYSICPDREFHTLFAAHKRANTWTI